MGNYDAENVRRTETCPDCIARDDVDLLGRPRRGRASRIRECLRCGIEEGKKRGTGRVKRTKTITLPWWVSGRREGA